MTASKSFLPRSSLSVYVRTCLVHALHCLLAGYGTAVWFDYVPSKANVSDKPSREPGLALDRFLVDESTGLESRPVPFSTYMPDEEAHDGRNDLL